MTELRTFQLPPETIEPLWNSLRARLLPAIERSRGMITEDEVFEKLTALQWQCWVAYAESDLKAAIVTRILESRSGKRVVQAVLAGGDDRRLWQRPIVERLKQFTQDEQCQALRIVGRKGWERVYPEFKVDQIVLEYAL